MQRMTPRKEIKWMLAVHGGYFLVKGHWGCAAGWGRSHFRNWIDYNGATLLVELLEWGRTFSEFLG